MSIVLIKQYIESDNREADGEALQVAFSNSGITAVVCPPGVAVEVLPAVGDMPQIAVINMHGDTKSIRDGADKLKADLKENNLQAIILPYNTNVEVLPVTPKLA